MMLEKNRVIHMNDEKDRENQESVLVDGLGFDSIEDFRDYCNRNN